LGLVLFSFSKVLIKVPFFTAPPLRREVGGKMIIETREGNKTKIKIVPDNWTPSDDLEQKDLTTSGRKSIGYSDIKADEWNRIFKKSGEK